MSTRHQASYLADLTAGLDRLVYCRTHGPIRRVTSVEDGRAWEAAIKECSPEMRREHLKWWGLNDLYMLLVCILRRPDMRHPWYFARCREVEEVRDNTQDYWSRGSGKSSIGSFGLIMQDLLINPNLTFGIFSHVRPIARKFLAVIKLEFETNDMLKELYPEVCWQHPEREAPKWSEVEGIVLKRTVNYREASVEAWGLVDGQPTSAHFDYRIYDDVIHEKSVTTPDMINKVTAAWELSLNLGARGKRFRVYGTWYAEGDTYSTMMERKIGPVRIRPPGYEGLYAPELTPEEVVKLRHSMSPRRFALQILLDIEKATESQGFDTDWLVFYDDDLPSLSSLNTYLIVDPAAGKKRSTSKTAMWVVGLHADKRMYVLDGVRDHLALTERGEAVFRLQRKYATKHVFYETYSMQGDIDYLLEKMAREQHRFSLIPLGGSRTKDDRVEEAIPLFAQRQVVFPRKGIWQPRKNKVSKNAVGYQEDGTLENIVQTFIDREYKVWPYTKEKDSLDAFSRLKDPAVVERLVWPRAYGQRQPVFGGGYGDISDGAGWMSG